MKLTRMFLAAGVGAVAMLAAAGTSSAALIVSTGGEDCLVNGAGPCTTQTITAHPAWQAPIDGGQWISYADTGFGGASLPVANGTIMTVIETINAGADWIDVWFNTWADDTADLYVNDVLIHAANPATDGTCSGPDPIGCEVGEEFFYQALLGPGVHTIRWEAYQLNGDVFGLMYAGEWNTVSVPEPGTLALLGLGLLGLGGAAIRRRRSA